MSQNEEGKTASNDLFEDDGVGIGDLDPGIGDLDPDAKSNGTGKNLIGSDSGSESSPDSKEIDSPYDMLSVKLRSGEILKLKFYYNLTKIYHDGRCYKDMIHFFCVNGN